ncbi:MAG: DUF3014 domain-containing protein [Woeseiaceae bacterium]|nr:DUF3014 domain-containing protein [Woeseiaceae bacterium]
MNDPNLRLLLVLLVALLAGGAVWYFWDDLNPSAQIPATPDAALQQDADAPAGPIHPIEPVEPPGPSDRELVPLPALDDSDSYFVLEMIDLFGPDAGQVLVSDALIDKFVATIDNLPRSHVAEKSRPVGRLASNFAIDESVSGDKTYLSPENYQRYSALVALVDNADMDAVAAMYRRFYPLFQESYVRLGYPNGYFNDRVVEVIDHLLATPEPDYPVELVRPNVLYQFADPKLESLSSGQKLLIRIGPENAATIKQALSELRARIT